MKMTMHIDEELLDRVVETFGCTSKTEAVEMALKEMDRKARFKEMVKVGMGFTAEELKNAVDPDYDVMSMRVAESSNRSDISHGRKRSR
ncbi:MAG: type II toxin-antitoxin system VapB family antitoxin [bacterium]